MLSPGYCFVSARLGFRDWRRADLDAMAALNADPLVMQYFPATQTRAQTAAFIDRMQQQFDDCGFTYFAVDVLANDEFIGFIGLCEQDYDAPFTPCVDIGWRLKHSAWHQGFATEGAQRCLDFAFNELRLEKIFAAACQVNIPSINVMKRIGMRYAMNFVHPALKDDVRLRDCVAYDISRNQYVHKTTITETR